MAKFKDLTGQTFNKLSVKFCDKRSENGRKRLFWFCECECGNTLWVRHDSLATQGNQSCGCIKTDFGRNVAARNIYRVYKKSADDRNIIFNLNIDEFSTIIEQNCFYCNSAPVTTTSYKDNIFLHNGIDRVDNNLGYTLDNCVPCCKRCNYAKHTMSLDSFMYLVEKIYKNKPQENTFNYFDSLDYDKKILYLRDTFPEFFRKFNKQNLDLGCGDFKSAWMQDSVTLDMFDYEQDVVWNLENTPLPLESNQFSKIKLQHVIEHIKEPQSFINLLNEIHRVSIPGGIFVGEAPHWTSVNFFRDPFHCRQISENTFDAFLENSPIHFGSGYGVKCKFRPVGQGIYVNGNRDVCWTLEVVK